MKNKRGFTLVELLAVIVILGILTAIAVPSVLGISNKIKENMKNSKLKTIEVAFELWADDNKDQCKDVKVEDLLDKNYLKYDDNNKNFLNPADNTDDWSKKTVSQLDIDVEKICKNKTQNSTSNKILARSIFENADSSFKYTDPLNPSKTPANDEVWYVAEENYREVELPLQNIDKIQNIAAEGNYGTINIRNNKVYVKTSENDDVRLTITYKDNTTKSIVVHVQPQSFVIDEFRSQNCPTPYNYQIRFISQNINFATTKSIITLYNSSNDDITSYYNIIMPSGVTMGLQFINIEYKQNITCDASGNYSQNEKQKVSKIKISINSIFEQEISVS